MLKGHASEGGIRTPCIVKLPGKSRTGWSSEFATVLDIAPTIYELVNVAYPESFRGQPPLALNGASLLGHLREEGTAVHSKDHGMGWELFGRTAYRKGRWKITWVEQPFGPGEFELFDILHDPGETDNLTTVRPKVFAELKAAWDQYVRRTGVVLSRPPSWDE
jgi:arylsulfatase